MANVDNWQAPAAPVKSMARGRAPINRAGAAASTVERLSPAAAYGPSSGSGSPSAGGVPGTA